MTQRKIFLSYSHQDRELLDAFRRHLSPFEREGALCAWHDEDILAGTDWDRELHHQMEDAEAAVVLVSPDALASDYIVETEIPRLITAADNGYLLLTYLFLRPAVADVLRFDIGDGQRVSLLRYQGLNSPDEPVTRFDGHERDALLAECARKLWDAVTSKKDRREHRRTRRAQELIVELRRQGNQVHRGYSKPAWGPLHQNHGEIDMTRLRHLCEHPQGDAELGEALFEVVLGHERQWSEVLRKALNRDNVTPSGCGVRLRLATEDAELQNLPWPSCHWNGYCLADMGWTFELSDGQENPPPVWLDTPCSALFLGAETEGSPPLGVEAHWSSFQALLNRAWDHPLATGLFQHAETPEALQERLVDGPRLIYFHGLARPGKDGFELVLRDNSGRPVNVPFSSLAAGFARRPPSVLFLNTIGECPLVLEVPGVPVVLHLRHEHAGPRARLIAQSWWSDVLERGWDPARAFHELGAGVRRRGAIRTHYATWEPRFSDITPKVHRPRARLDRRVQRERIMSMIRDLASHQHRRVTAAVIHGSPGNLVEHFVSQVLDTLKDWARGLARVQRRDLRFPRGRGNLTSDDFLELLRDAMHLQPEQDLDAAFLPKHGGPAKVTVHFLNWGCYGPGHRDTLKASDLDAWLDFCAGPLATAVQGKNRILSYVALAVPLSVHEALEERFKKLLPRLRQPHFEMDLLRPLGEITPKDLDDFLSSEDNTSCPPEYRHDIAERICEETQGEFEATVKLLEDAERGMMWPELYHTLPQVAPPTSQLEDFDLE